MIMRSVKQDLYSRTVRAPKILVLDHREASVYVGEQRAKQGWPATPEFSATVVPHTLPATGKLILDVHRGGRRDQVLVRPGTTVVYRDTRPEIREVLVFVTPKAVASSPRPPGR